MEAPLLHGSRTCIDKGHTLVDYEYILQNGLNSYVEKVEKELTSFPNNQYLIAMKDTLSSTKIFISKMLEATEEKIKSLDVYPRRLCQIKSALEQVPFHPARNFREAIQAVWIIHFLTPLAENAWYSISLGKPAYAISECLL